MMDEAQLKKMAKAVFNKVYDRVQEYASDVPPIHFEYDPGMVTSFVPTPGGLIVTQARHDNGGKVVEVLLTQELIDILDEAVCKHNKCWRSEEEHDQRRGRMDGYEEVAGTDLEDILKDS